MFFNGFHEYKHEIRGGDTCCFEGGAGSLHLTNRILLEINQSTFSDLNKDWWTITNPPEWKTHSTMGSWTMSTLQAQPIFLCVQGPRVSLSTSQRQQPKGATTDQSITGVIIDQSWHFQWMEWSTYSRHRWLEQRPRARGQYIGFSIRWNKENRSHADHKRKIQMTAKLVVLMWATITPLIYFILQLLITTEWS